MVDGGDLFYEAIQKMASHESFKGAISRLPDSMKEQRANEELVLRFFALINSRDQFKGNIEEWLDGYMEDILFRRQEFELDRMEKVFKDTFDLIYSKLGDEAFTRFNSHGEATGRLAPAYYEAVCAAFVEKAEKLEDIGSAALLERLRAAFESAEFKSATGPGANTIPKLHQRIQVVSDYLSADISV